MTEEHVVLHCVKRSMIANEVYYAKEADIL